MICRFCGADITDDLLHQLHCDGRQGQVDALAPYEPHENVRTTDPDTSKAAAHSLVDVSEVQRRVYAIHLSTPGGLTDEELLAEYKRRWGVVAESSPRKRRHDLMRLGWIVDSGERRALASGRQGIVWKVAVRVAA